MRSSLMTGYSLRTSAAASRPSSTSCFGVYLFFGGFTTVCAKTPAVDIDRTIARAAARVEEVLIVTAPSRVACPIPTVAALSADRLSSLDPDGHVELEQILEGGDQFQAGVAGVERPAGWK